MRPRILVVSGARSNVGKTTLASALCRLIPGAVHVKLGHGPRKKELHNIYLPAEASLSEIIAAAPDARYLVIESNRILGEITPDCAIYLPAENPKATAGEARRKADIVRGERASPGTVKRLSSRLGLPVGAVLKIMDAAGAFAGEETEL